MPEHKKPQDRAWGGKTAVERVSVPLPGPEDQPTNIETRPAPSKINPHFFIWKRLKGTRELSDADKIVALAIADRMAWDPEAGEFNAFIHTKTLAADTGRSIRSVKRSLSRFRNKVFAVSRPGRTRGHAHRCYRYTLILDPVAFERGRRNHVVRKAVKDIGKKRMPAGPSARDLEARALEMKASLCVAERREERRKAPGGGLSEAEWEARRAELDAQAEALEAEEALKRSGLI